MRYFVEIKKSEGLKAERKKTTMDKWPCLFLQLKFKAQNKCKSKIRKGRSHLDVFTYLTTQKR